MKYSAQASKNGQISLSRTTEEIDRQIRNSVIGDVGTSVKDQSKLKVKYSHN